MQDHSLLDDGNVSTEHLLKRLRMLKPHQIQMIDEALQSVGEYGEVHLALEKGRLRFIVTQKSVDALKWQPGAFA